MDIASDLSEAAYSDCPSRSVLDAPCIELVAHDHPALFEEEVHVHPETALLLYAEAGTFGLRTEDALWLSSPGCAIWTPVDCASGVAIASAPARLRSLHFKASVSSGLPRTPQVLRGRPFLRPP